MTALFRDTHVDPTGAETILHEYALTATVDAATGAFTSCSAVPRVLPWVECPVAAASADRLVGQPVADGPRLRAVVAAGHLHVHPPQRPPPLARRRRHARRLDCVMCEDGDTIVR